PFNCTMPKPSPSGIKINHISGSIKSAMYTFLPHPKAAISRYRNEGNVISFCEIGFYIAQSCFEKVTTGPTTSIPIVDDQRRTQKIIEANERTLTIYQI